MRSFTLIFLLLAISCQSSKKEEKKDVSKLKKEVMAIHDDVMPKMGALRRASKELMALGDSIQPIDSARAATYLNAAQELVDANESMMEWMRQYEPEFTGDDDEVWNYYTLQKEEIKKVSDLMNNELKEGQALLNQ